MRARWVVGRFENFRPTLQAFRCADDLPPFQAGGPRHYRQRHPQWWAYQVEVNVHRLTNRGLQPHEVLLTGWIDDELVAVALLVKLDGWHEVDVALVAISRELQGTGLAREMCNAGLAEIENEALADGVSQTLINGYVWPENVESNAMCEANGAEVTAVEENGARRWTRLLTHARPENDEDGEFASAI